MERPPLYPILVDLHTKDVLVVGAGRNALRETRALVRHGARPRVIAPVFEPEFAELPVERIVRHWRPGDEGRARLVVAATADAAVNRAVFANCSQQRILCHVVGVPELSDYHPTAPEELGA